MYIHLHTYIEREGCVFIVSSFLVYAQVSDAGVQESPQKATTFDLTVEVAIPVSHRDESHPSQASRSRLLQLATQLGWRRILMTIPESNQWMPVRGRPFMHEYCQILSPKQGCQTHEGPSRVDVDCSVRASDIS